MSKLLAFYFFFLCSSLSFLWAPIYVYSSSSAHCFTHYSYSCSCSMTIPLSAPATVLASHGTVKVLPAACGGLVVLSILVTKSKSVANWWAHITLGSVGWVSSIPKMAATHMKSFIVIMTFEFLLWFVHVRCGCYRLFSHAGLSFALHSS